MGRRQKLKKFAELKTFPHVLEWPKNVAGSWPQPLIVEVGCGYGEYALALAQRHPENHYLGLDIQGERLWRAAKEMQTLKLDNVWWLRGYADHLLDYFAPGEIAELWLTFPDPFPRKGDAKKRLTSPRFLSYYQRLLTLGGRVHLKTDSNGLYLYSQETIAASGATIDRQLDMVPADMTEFDLDIPTRFEQKHRNLGSAIHYLSWFWPTEL
jgi:tRNA (guanine-N7-)-methyltransferase